MMARRGGSQASAAVVPERSTRLPAKHGGAGAPAERDTMTFATDLRPNTNPRTATLTLTALAGLLLAMASAPATAQPWPDEGWPEPCIGPQNIRGHSADGKIFLQWDAFVNATGQNPTRLYRDDGDGFELINTLDIDVIAYTDHNVDVGASYTYHVTALIGDGEERAETEPCDLVEITAIPVFPGLVSGLLAGTAGVGAYVLGRRRG